MKWCPLPNGSIFKDCLTNEERKTLADDGATSAYIDDAGRIGIYNVACYEDVWDSANPRADTSKDIRAIMKKDRREDCFFYTYTPGIYFPAARELEQRNADRREAKRDRFWVKCGVWVAVAAVLLTLVWDVYKYCVPRDVVSSSDAKHASAPSQPTALPSAP
jgi:hypothetical protein